MYLHLLIVGYFCLCYGQTAATTTIVPTTPVPHNVSPTSSPVTTRNTAVAEIVLPELVSLPIILGIRTSVRSTIELNHENIQPQIQQILHLLQPYVGSFTFTVRSIQRITPQ
ncbi:hypothetical protein AGOR_G00238980 [Albula goreensis]|uniref:Uncharacterized protein n=1 Tax=Albula goreensis TaxID=1534307 RepID=A0A8T3CD28_9TELE|nr:hypothetical protein AGOR_G00238980 [Albula goreensis]